MSAARGASSKAALFQADAHPITVSFSIFAGEHAPTQLNTTNPVFTVFCWPNQKIKPDRCRFLQNLPSLAPRDSCLLSETLTQLRVTKCTESPHP